MTEATLKDFTPLVADPLTEVVERPWRRGLPPGPATPETVAKFEVFFSPAGLKWHRPRAALSHNAERG
jgi:hypothetical protein